MMRLQLNHDEGFHMANYSSETSLHEGMNCTEFINCKKKKNKQKTGNCWQNIVNSINLARPNFTHTEDVCRPC
jgi:hypothetical protein